MLELRDRWKKLAQLANFLDDLPHRKFHMPKWCSADATETSCGTAGCAAGWAATIFNKEGWYCIPATPGRSCGQLVLNCKERDPIYSPVEAFAYFFGISDNDSLHITANINPGCGINQSKYPTYCDEFGVGSNDITPVMVASRIRSVLRKYDPTVLEEPMPKVILELTHVA